MLGFRSSFKGFGIRGLGFRVFGGVGFTRTPQWPFNGALMVLNSGYLG